MKRRTRWIGVLAGCTALALAGELPAQSTGGSNGDEANPAMTPATHELLVAGHRANPSNWPMYGGDYDNRRYSPLDQVNTDNVGSLSARWMYQTGIAKSFETTPVVIDGEMYITTPSDGSVQRVLKLDAKTGEVMWDHAVRLATTIFCCGPNNRGVAVWDDKVYVATLDARLVALSRADGSEVWASEIADPEAGYSETMAPLVYDGKVIIGTSGAEYGIRGFLKAYDANSGDLLWTWHTIPSPEQGGWWGDWNTTTPYGEENLNRDIQQEKADSAKYADAWKRGGGSIWMTPALDPESGLVFVTIGNPSPDLDGSIRPGDNLWTESVCAIEAADGDMRWCTQYLPHDVWDLDAASPAVIIDYHGEPAVGHAGKTGWYYVFDIETGEILNRSENFVPHENLFALPTAEGTRMLPGANGGAEWSPQAYHPGTALAYVLALHQPMHYKTHYSPYEKGELWLGSAFVAIPGEEQWGRLVAVSPETGEVVWQHDTEEPLIGGALATAGGLVFFGENNGNFNAMDATTGERLWHFNAGAGCNSAPMTYSVDGQQYIAVACGGVFQTDAPRGDALIVFGLPSGGM
ncbi:MAG: PQQ-binding-like beta-propeller repeat protein [Gemmatimonadetes bacterium]|uniref:PQQ-binding-like beta-propeller repeat protein n=1 Tax=Candidatus Kutchimonas denitrificans TaxID=3056748 RepID=A0AAE5C7N2_9BACT|nr:PQQ-binding-like beta-propeller repeat protein [Gemmatimonadota bacterium]NIR73621.1 PQQ-binding-like beta-propeller repeat protein [Candidatus Kutchimonas denitrificans]NIR99580.1 PQQ-binding-like beta-propeller repeat protein [Gemmatimonadota bacterium]NIT65200.1 PQQ-binding-like beta-propeller repeat protein [Gemmatimonadota bacterium]NIV23733.1 PQQ-binding-like beta-propeller repeat protein [Gemmatimonadota bacterium]